MKPNLIIIGGPSGGGKTTICNFIAGKFPNIKYYKNQPTTRKPRPNEGKKGAYKSISLASFNQLDKKGQLLMKTKFAGNYYGYTKSFLSDVKKQFKQKKSLVIDSIQPVSNWIKFKNRFPHIPIITICLYSKNLTLLKARIMQRSNSSPEDVAKRLAHAKKVISELSKYDLKVDTTNLHNLHNKINLIIKKII